jgi:ankyrin repeat protein
MKFLTFILLTLFNQKVDAFIFKPAVLTKQNLVRSPECLICERFPNQDLIKTVCDHTYHKTCLLEYRSKSITYNGLPSNCPYCFAPEEVFMKAARDGDLQKVESELARLDLAGKWLINLNSHDGQALVLASENGHLDIVQELIDKAANVHGQDDKALILASKNGHRDIVELLLNKGANVDAQEGQALVFASINGFTEIVKLLLVHKATKGYGDSLRAASKGGHVKIVERLLKNGAVIDDVDTNGHSALDYASAKGHDKVVKILIQNGAVVGTRAIELAKNNGHSKVVKLLSNPPKGIKQKIGSAFKNFFGLKN